MKEARVFNCTVTTHEYAPLIGEVVEILQEDVTGDDEWMLVVFEGVPYIVNQADIELEE